MSDSLLSGERYKKKTKNFVELKLVKGSVLRGYHVY